MKLNNEKINKGLEMLATMRQEVAEMIKQEQESCQHANIAECPYENYSISQPPVRICLDCGVTETGWSFKVLYEKNTNLTPRGISRELLFKLKNMNV